MNKYENRFATLAGAEAAIDWMLRELIKLNPAGEIHYRKVAYRTDAKTMKYSVLIQGSLGPDTWDHELKIDAVDFMDAAKQAVAKAEEMRGSVTSIEQSE